MKAVALTVAAMLVVSASAFAEGGKQQQRLADRLDQITDGQVLCEEDGVQIVVLKDETSEITIACNKLAPETSPAPKAR
jgi:hypothetical protein